MKACHHVLHLSISASAWQWVVHMKVIMFIKKGLLFGSERTLFETNHIGLWIVILEIS